VAICIDRQRQRHRRRHLAEGIRQLVLEYTVVWTKAVVHDVGEARLHRLDPLALVKNLDVTIHLRPFYSALKDTG